MDGFLFLLLFLGIWVVVITVISSAVRKSMRRPSTISSDGHAVSPEEDLTCETKDGHVHRRQSAEDIANYGRRYIVHNDPETGYVILNGVKRRISDCKDL